MREESISSTRAKARLLGLARSTLFYRKKRPKQDWALKCCIEEVLREFPAYGYRRLAQTLGINSKRIRRVMRLFGIKPYRRRGKRWRKPKRISTTYPNLLMTITPYYEHHAWVADFTHLSFKGKDVRVATTMDVFTRKVVGIAVGVRGGTALVTEAFGTALLNNPRPHLFHSDNGVEYNARSFRELLSSLGIQISRSKKGCPWENGYQESFYDKFKVELGDPSRFDSLGELVAEIYRTIYRYNTRRIHSALKMPPQTFALLHADDTLKTIVH